MPDQPNSDNVPNQVRQPAIVEKRLPSDATGDKRRPSIVRRKWEH